MQVNVDAITAAATAAGFALVSDRVFTEPTAFPALCVYQRTLPEIGQDEAGIFWHETWRYQVAVFVKTADFTEMETLESTLDAELKTRECNVTSRMHYEAMVNNVDVIVSLATVTRAYRRQFLPNE